MSIRDFWEIVTVDPLAAFERGRQAGRLYLEGKPHEENPYSFHLYNYEWAKGYSYVLSRSQSIPVGPMKTYRLHWHNGSTEVGIGDDPLNAFRNLGYDHTSVDSLNFIKEVNLEDIEAGERMSFEKF